MNSIVGPIANINIPIGIDGDIGGTVELSAVGSVASEAGDELSLRRELLRAVIAMVCHVQKALLVYGCAAFSWRGPRWLVSLGDASYSLYLLHATLISVLLKLAAAAEILPWAGTAVGNAALYVATGIAAVVFHRWVEAPLLAGCRRGLLGRDAAPGARAPALSA